MNNSKSIWICSSYRNLSLTKRQYHLVFSRRFRPELTYFIVKKKQLLRSLSSIDFSFIMQENISKIFKILHEYKLKVGLIQNAAISFSICIEDQYNNFEAVKIILSKKFKVAYNENVSLEGLN